MLQGKMVSFDHPAGLTTVCSAARSATSLEIVEVEDTEVVRAVEEAEVR